MSWKDHLRYFRCHSIADGRCTCSDPGGPRCKAGKHPVARGWQQEALGHQAITFPMQAKLVVVSNTEPILDLDDAMRDRVHVVPFNVKFRGVEGKDDKGLKDYLKTKELPGIARWVVNGCRQWQETRLKPPASVRQRTEQYFKNADVFDQFLRETCDFAPQDQEFSPEFFTPTVDLLRAARVFCDDRGERGTVTSERMFVAALKERKPELKNDRPRGKGFSGKSGFFGVKLLRGSYQTAIEEVL